MKKHIIKILISLSILSVLLFHLDWKQLTASLLEVNLFIYGLALTALVAQVALLAGRWMLLVNADRQRIDYKTSLRITIASLLANLIFVTSVSGVLVKVGLTTQYGLSILKSICAAVADRLMTLASLLVFGLLFLPYLAIPDHAQIFKLSTLIVAGFIALTMIAHILLRGFYRDFVFMNRKISVSIHYARSILANQKLLAKIVIVSLLAQFTYFVAVELTAFSMNVNLPFLQLLTVLPIMTLIASLPVGFGGWGIREGAFIYGLSLIGVPAETAFLISVQIGVLSMLSVAAIGLPALFTGDAPTLIKKAMSSRYGRRQVVGK